jgi:hypothetical protein
MFFMTKSMISTAWEQIFSAKVPGGPQAARRRDLLHIH